MSLYLSCDSGAYRIRSCLDMYHKTNKLTLVTNKNDCNGTFETFFFLEDGHDIGLYNRLSFLR